MALDPYSRAGIANYLQLPVQVIAGSTVKLLLRMGDGFAKTCTLLVSDEELCDPRIIERICYGAAFAFNPVFGGGTAAECLEDRRPTYSIFLLEELRSRTTDERILLLIERVLDILKSVDANNEV